MAPPAHDNPILYISSDDENDDDNNNNNQQQQNPIFYISSDEDENENEDQNPTDEDELNQEYDFSESKPNPKSSTTKNYTILNPQQISKLQSDAISNVINVLSVSKPEACVLLHRYNWNPNIVSENWFADEDSVRKSLGLSLLSQFVNVQPELTCQICFDDSKLENFLFATCGHKYCVTCWKSYVKTSINDGPGCLNLRCPDFKCNTAVGLDLIGLVGSREDQEKYNRFMIRSFVENNKSRKWCPSPGCDFAVEFNDDGGKGEYDVTCDCGWKFCWSCTEESHRPIDCETLEKWETKNGAEANNTKWILAYTKPCPKCKRPIEKNKGCNHMSCTAPCGFYFCWICLKSLSGHVNCNAYKPVDETVATQEMARKHLEKYTHYYERWAANDKSKKKALADLGKLEKNEVVEELMFDCVIGAWKQIVECREILKWSYVYGYYLSEEKGVVNSRKMVLFEYLQGQAETVLEKLHHCAEGEFDKELIKYRDGECTPKEFVDFRMKLKSLTRVTSDHFEKLVGGLKNGLSEVDSKSGGHHTKKKPRVK